MEKIFAQLLYSTLKDNPSAKETLTRLLKFYAENKELIRLVFGVSQIASPAAVEGAPASKEEKESRPPEESAGSTRVLEEYLNRINL